MTKKILYINGDDFSTMEEFFNKITEVLEPGAAEGWIHSLDALNDVLYRGDNKPPEGFDLVWKNSDLSKSRLGYPETVRQLEKYLLISHPANKKVIQEMIDLAKQNKGPTMFDEIVGVFQQHDDIQLILE